MVHHSSANQGKFRFSLANMLKAVTWLGIGWGGTAAFVYYRDQSHSPAIGFLGTAVFFISLGAALGALAGQTKAGFLLGVVLLVVFCVLACCIVFVLYWFHK
jgi:hypothetical protein